MMSGGGVGGGGREPVKIVMINTQYIETDERSFKSVVQELTGKDSVVSNIITNAGPGNNKQYCGTKTEGGMIPQSESNSAAAAAAAAGSGGGGGGGGFNINIEMKEGTSNKSFLMRDLSFKEFDRLLKEMPMPPLDQSWAD